MARTMSVDLSMTITPPVPKLDPMARMPSKPRKCPSVCGGGLASQRVNLVAVVIPSLSNMVFPDVLGGISAELDDTGLQPVVGVTNYSPPREDAVLYDMLSWRPSGVILAGLEHSKAARAMLDHAGLPVVEIMDIDGEPIDCAVGISHRRAGAEMAEEILNAGYRRIGFIGTHMPEDHRARKRLAGFEERLAEAGVFTTLTMTIAAGVNDDDIGAVVLKALDTPFVGGVALQPVFGSGRGRGIDPLDRVTHTGALERLGPQTGGVVAWHDLIGLPCSHPHCASVGYLLKDDAGVWRSLCALVGHDQLLAWLELDPDALANRIADHELPAQLRELMRTSLLDLMSEVSSLSHPRTAQLWQNICTQCDLGIGTLTTLAAGKLPGQQNRLRRLLAERVVRITVKPFMDISTMIEERLTQCCVHVGTKSAADAHQCAPFCAVQAWPQLADQRLSTATTRRELRLVETSRAGS